jgi:hypothetical protein
MKRLVPVAFQHHSLAFPAMSYVPNGLTPAWVPTGLRWQWIDRTEQVNLNELFVRMTQEELEMYARDGQLPVWFTQTVVATPKDSQEIKNDT